MAPKRKADVKQPSLEEVTEQPVTKKRSKKGNLANPEVKKDDTSSDDFVRAKLARKHGEDPAFKKAAARPAKSEESPKAAGEKPDYVEINRAPVLTAWVTAVAQRQGMSRESGMTFGKAISSMLAQSKGRSIGVFEQKEDDTTGKVERQEHEADAGVEMADVFGMKVKAVRESGELRALELGSDAAIDAAKVDQYLKRAFKDRLSDTEGVMKELAESYGEDKIGGEAYRLYEQFRPSVPQGKQGWGKRGRLEFERLRELKSSS